MFRKLMITFGQIQEFAQQIAESYQPDSIILFGSQADGTATADSDVDLLVVMRHSARKSVYKSVEIATSLRPTFPVDLLVRTPDEIATAIERGDPIIKTILKEGTSLYARGNS